jgi:hypothetical protein
VISNPFSPCALGRLGVTCGRTPGRPNVFLEARFGRPATTRNWNTVVRLVRKFG